MTRSTTEDENEKENNTQDLLEDLVDTVADLPTAEEIGNIIRREIDALETRLMKAINALKNV